MTFKNALCSCLIAFFTLKMQAQAPPPTPAPAPAPAARPAPDVVAGIPVNYDEAKVGTYTLPDPLKLNNGKPVRNAKTWTTKRRPEIVKIFETQQYGIAPGRPVDGSFEVVDKGTPAMNGKAIRKQVTIHLSKDENWPAIHLLIYLPAAAKKPVPMFFTINFGAIQNAVDDPGIIPEKVRDLKTNALITPPAAPARSFGRINVQAFLDAGIGVATYYYAELDPDTLTGFPEGIRAKYLKAGQTERAPDDWGSIAAWAWGMSRVEDYFETDKDIDAKRVAIHGVSRLGKTVAWAGANDQRFAAVIASCGGEGGAALSHRNYGETIAHLTAPTRYPYQFAANYAKYGGFP
ncbi:MAG TPA: acetylxylan esterase, partial [Acidobacteriaceae bacterium]